MNSLILMAIGVSMMAVGYFLYSKFLGSRIYRLSDSYKTPAHTMEDGVDFVPTNKYVLWGHHFTSVAGAAPIIGPAVAVIWGWLPAFLWVTIGTVFMAGMHDLGALWASQRHRGQSIGTLSGRYIGARGRNLFLVVIFLLLLMVNTAFGVVISNLLVSTPTSVIPTWGAIIVALLVGQAIYRLKWSLPLVSVVGVVALYTLMIIGDRFPIVLPETVLGIPANGVWIIVLFVYAFIASLLPVWMLLQPRDYINGLQLFIGLGILYASFLFTAPDVVAPALRDNLPAETPGIFPLLFVTIACGAISGFHGMVASGTSSKQLDKETDARFVGYFGAVGEGLLALGTVIATTSGFKTLADWEQIYSEWNAGGVSAFVEGGGNLINEGLGISTSLSATILATMAVLFAATTMDSGVRLQRFVVQEIGEIMGLQDGRPRRNVHRSGYRLRPHLLAGRGRFRRHDDLAALRYYEPAHGGSFARRHHGHSHAPAPPHVAGCHPARLRYRDVSVGCSQAARHTVGCPELAALRYGRRHRCCCGVGHRRGYRRRLCGTQGPARRVE